MAARGGFQHIYYVDKGAISYILELYYFSQVLCVIADAFGKISIAFLLLRVMGSTQKWKKYLLYIVIALTAIITILFSFLAFFQCTDPRALWNKASFPNAKCWKPMVVARWTLFVSGISAAVTSTSTANYESMDDFCGFFPGPIPNLHHTELAHGMEAKTGSLRTAWIRCHVRWLF